MPLYTAPGLFSSKRAKAKAKAKIIPPPSGLKSFGKLPFISSGTRVPPRHPRNAYERAVLKLPPQYRPDSAFPTDDEIDRMNRVLGSKEDELEAHRTLYHRQWDEIFAKTGRDTLHVLGLKPQPGEPIHIFPIPDSSTAIRLWDGGLEAQGQYCLDFVDLRTRHAVNSPEDWTLCPAAHFVSLVPDSTVRIKSWEEAWGIEREDISPGEERFSIMQGVWCALKRPAHDAFWFEVPRAQAPLGIAQSILTVAE